jgi:uncharacterized protein YndB with AHSA1/START domain
MTQKFTVSAVIPAKPKAIYDAWLDSRGHAGMTAGGKAKGSTRIGGKHTAWDGYISGVNLELVPNKRIVQSWRSAEFTADDKDSKITVTLKPGAGGTKVTLLHSGVPDSHTGYKAGWHESYFDRMKAYFGKTAPKKKPRAKEMMSAVKKK